MKKFLLLAVLVSPFAMADESTTNAPATAAKPEETVTLSQEVTAPLWERVRGAHERALKEGKVVASNTAAPKTTH